MLKQVVGHFVYLDSDIDIGWPVRHSRSEDILVASFPRHTKRRLTMRMAITYNMRWISELIPLLVRIQLLASNMGSCTMPVKLHQHLTVPSCKQLPQWGMVDAKMGGCRGSERLDLKPLRV